MEALYKDFYSQLVGKEEFIYLHPHPRHYGRMLLHLARSEARGCLIFQAKPCLPSFSRFWARGWARWVVKALQVKPTFLDNATGWHKTPVHTVFCLEFDFNIADPFGF